MAKRSLSAKAWVVSAPLGKGIDIVAQACRPLAGDIGVIRADRHPGNSRRERALWAKLQERPSFLASLGTIPVVGQRLKKATERFIHRLPSRYAQGGHQGWNRRLVEFYYYLQNQDLGKEFIQELARNPLPLITSSPVIAFSAEVHAYPGPIILVSHAADPSRTWASLEPRQTRIQHIVATQMAEDRLKAYGVPATNIHHFGLPLAESAVSSKGLLQDVERRVHALDPGHIFRPQTKRHATARPLTLGLIVENDWRTTELLRLFDGTSRAVRAGELVIHLFTGTDTARARSIEALVRNKTLHRHLGSSLVVHTHDNETQAFESFAQALPDMDLLWTTPNPWVFYAGLGIPVIVQPPVGGQEEARYAWVRGVQAGLPPLELQTAGDWLLDWKRSGGLARLAWNGYGSAPSMGLTRLKQLIEGKHPHDEKLHATIPE